MLDSTADIAVELLRQASAALDSRRPEEAVQLYLRGLHYAFVQPEQHTRHIAITLLGLGRALGYMPNRAGLAVACCEASASLFKREGRSEVEADRIYMAALIVNALEDYATARGLMQAALERYRALNLAGKARTVNEELRDMMRRLGERRYREIMDATISSRAFGFDILADGVRLHHVVVSREGTITHYPHHVAPALIETWGLVISHG